MKRESIIIGLMGLMGLMGCSKDDEAAQESRQDTTEQELQGISVSASVCPLVEASTTGSANRSWAVPTGYYLYDNLYGATVFQNSYTLTDKTIDVYFTQNTELSPLHGRLKYISSTGKWKFVTNVDLESIERGQYYAYGFISRDAADEATIAKLPAPNDSYPKGAVLTIHGMKTVAADACVIVGAKEGPDADHDNGLTTGDFSFTLETGKDGSGNPKENYLYFLFDHLCSALIINIKVDPEYNALRHIKLKNIYLQTATALGITKKKTDVTVTLAHTEGTSPIQEITYTPSGEDTSGDYVFTSASGLLLTTNFSSAAFLSHFIPKDVTKIVLTCTYDVYDTDTSKDVNGNLVRKGCTATNTIPLTKIDRFTVAERGKKYIVNMTIKPTYLYMLSEPDLNNPVMIVE